MPKLRSTEKVNLLRSVINYLNQQLQCQLSLDEIGCSTGGRKCDSYHVIAFTFVAVVSCDFCQTRVCLL